MFSNHIFKEPLLLASTSPRRAEILSSAGWPFEIVKGSVDESLREGEAADAYVRRLARDKAMNAAANLRAGLILAADTTVVIDDEILGQPEDDDDARRMLTMLSGKTHEVLTGVALVRAENPSTLIVDHETTRVRFSSMSQDEIDWYVATGEPRGKAGAYAIQGRAALFIDGVEGDYFNIVGLPIRLVYKLAREIRKQ